MAYINRIVGPEEHLYGIARLHWIYILKGVVWFLICALFGWALNTGVLWFLSAVGQRTLESPTSLPFLLISGWLIPASLTVGVIIFSFYLLKVLCTEIGLSDRRVIHKRGLLFVDVHEVDIEEIRGERLDLGTFGRILGYGYIHLDCRFIGDVQLPAIEQPERFLRALHDVRSKSMENITMVMGKGRGVGVNIQEAPEQPPRHDMPPPPPQLSPEEQQRLIEQYQLEQQQLEYLRQHGQYRRVPQQRYRAVPGQSLRQAIQEDLAHGPDIPDHPVSDTPPPPAVPPPPPPFPEWRALQHHPQTPPPAQAVPPVDPVTVAKIVEQVVPQVVEKIVDVEKIVEAVKEKEPETQSKSAPRMTAKMKAEGLRAQPPLEKAEVPLEEELLVSFDEASSAPVDGKAPPAPAPTPEPGQAAG